MTDLTKMSDEEVQRHIWEQRCPELLTHAEALAEAIWACIGDAEGQEAVAPGSRTILTLTNGQARLLSTALARYRGEK